MQVHIGILGTTALLLFTVFGCASAPPPVPVAAVDLDTAMQAYERAEGRTALRDAIIQLEAYALAHPGDYASRARLANAYTLLGAGYTNTATEKETAYKRAMHFAEAAMMTDAGFAHVWGERGVGLHMAVQQLGETHLEAMEFWQAAQLFYFDECAGPVDRLLRYGRLQQALAVIKRIEQIDPQAGAGNNRFAEALYYLAIPETAGGEPERVAALMASAVAVHPHNILPRWGRGKYYAVAMADRRQFRKDLQWVASQPLDELTGHRPWNVFLQRDARMLLSQTDQIFAP